MRVVLELFRIILIIALLGIISGAALQMLYASFHIHEKWRWLGAIGILLLLFILYRMAQRPEGKIEQIHYNCTYDVFSSFHHHAILFKVKTPQPSIEGAVFLQSIFFQC